MNLDINTVLMNTPFKGIEKLKKVYFIGIGGIGMSAIARFFYNAGVDVSGYDKTKTALTAELENMGIMIHYEESVGLIPKEVDLVVYTPAIPREHAELVYYREHGYKVVKRSEVLELITESSFNICIAGTHGKTTITTMTAHLLRDSGFGCNAFLGGIAVNYNSNFWSDKKNVCVIEADEYDRSFLRLKPNFAVITAMDADHLDIYGTAGSMEKAFIDFSNKVQDGGLLISHFGLKREKELSGMIKVSQLTYSLNDPNADAYAMNIRMENGSYEFDAKIAGQVMENVKLNMGGLHNIENAIAAITIASSLHIDPEKIRSAVESFKGVRRRFEYIVRRPGLVFIDDYAHHPEELIALINGAKGLFPEKKCTVIFQPHLFSRTRDLADDFAKALDLADEVVLLPIYPARELPIEGVTSEMILERMRSKNKLAIKGDDLQGWIQRNVVGKREQLLITAGAGDIDRLVEPIKKLID